MAVWAPPPDPPTHPPTHPDQKSFLREKNQIHQMCPKLEVNFRYTNFFFGPLTPSPPTYVCHHRDGLLRRQSAINCSFGLACSELHAREQRPLTRDALEGKAPQRRPQKRSDRRLEEVAKAVWGGYCRLQMPLRLALGIRGTVAGHRLGAQEGGPGGTSPPSNASLPLAASSTRQPTTRNRTALCAAEGGIIRRRQLVHLV